MKQAQISDVIHHLGGTAPKGNRFTAFERGSGDLNRSISTEGTQWFDHVTQQGGDAASLAQTVLGLSVGEALAWLEERGLRDAKKPMSRTAIERARADREETEQKHVAMLDFASALWRELDGAKLAAWDMEDWTKLSSAAELQFQLSTNGRAVFEEFETTKPAAARRLIAAGRTDRNDAALLTAAAVQILSMAVEHDAR